MGTTIIRVAAAVCLIPCLYAGWLITLSAEAQLPPPNQGGVCTPLPVIIDSHRCLHVAKGTPHFDAGTAVEVIVQEDRRAP